MPVVSFYEPIYRSRIFIYIGPPKAFVRWMARAHQRRVAEKDHGAAESMWWFDDIDRGWNAVIRLPYWRVGNPWEAGVLAHEAQHVTSALAKPRRLKGEARNYYLQWLVEEATRRLNARYRRKVR